MPSSGEFGMAEPPPRLGDVGLMVESGYIRRDDFTDEDGNTIPAVDFEGLIAKLAGAAEGNPTPEAVLCDVGVIWKLCS